MIEVSEEMMNEASEKHWEFFKKENPEMFGLLTKAKNLDFFKNGYKVGFFAAHKLLTRIHKAKVGGSEKLIQSLKKKADLWDDARDCGHAYASLYGQIAGLVTCELNDEAFAKAVKKFYSEAKEKADAKINKDRPTGILLS